MTKKQNFTFKKAVSLAAAAVFAATMLQTGGGKVSFAEDADASPGASVSLPTDLVVSGSENAYRNYIKKYPDAAKPKEAIDIDVTSFTSEDGTFEKTDFEGETDCVSWLDSEGTISWKFNVPAAGLYNLRALYYPVAGNNTTVEIEIKLDGDYPFDETKLIELDRYWHNKTEIRLDERKKNQKRPPQGEYDCWVDYPIKDKDGLINTPYFFYLSEGEHTLSFTGVKTNIYIKGLTFYNEDELPSYAEIRPSEAEIKNTPAINGGAPIRVEAETPKYTSASVLYPTYDRTDCTMSPHHPVNKCYNTIGADTWSKATQTVVYEVAVPADGYYTLNLKVRQSTMRGFFSNRRIYVNGVVPCKELDDVKINYSAKWQTITPQTEDGEDIYIKLHAGMNTIAFEAIPGDIGEVMERLDDIVLRLNQYYRRIVMITSTDPDEYTDYMLEEQIPELIDVFQDSIDKLLAEKKGIEALSGHGGSEATTLETLAVVLKMAVKKPQDIPMMVSSRGSGIRDQINAVSAWMRDYRGQPLEMDYFELKTAGEDFGSAKANFFEQFAFGFKAFIGSFFEDYTSVSADSGSKTLNVWVSLGRDQATVINELISSEYNPEHSTQVGIKLVQGAILEATLADKGPEVALFIGGDFPVVCASRGLVVNLKEMNDFNTVMKRFPDSISTLYQYEDGVYGLPLTESFPMMFYRTDVLEELGQKPPETWDELIDMLPDLQRKYLQVGLILPSNISSQVFDAGNTFVLLMNQTGQNFYNDQLTQTTFDTEMAVEAFTKWTKFYTVYDFKQAYDPFSLFRTGEMPILMQNYSTFYSQLNVAAPEIKGLWSFTHVPGTKRVDADGNEFIDYTANSGSAGAVIFTSCTDTDGAWDFIKWFTSTDVQVEYGRTIEAVMGPLGRYDTANVEALGKLNWSTAEYNKIADQMSHLNEVPIIPASYAVTRNVYNAFRAVVNNQKNPRFQLSSFNRDINAEIVRKLRDLGYEIDDDGNRH